MNAVLTCLGLVVLWSVASAQDLVPPAGWRLPSAAELASHAFRNDSVTKYASLVADFNGDGLPDKAFVVTSTLFDGEALLVHLSARHGPGKSLILGKRVVGEKSRGTPPIMGISLVEPGEYDYICAEGSRNCGEASGAQPRIRTLYPGIRYFKPESASSIVYWDQKKARFIRLWESD